MALQNATLADGLRVFPQYSGFADTIEDMLGFDARAARAVWTVFLVALLLYLVFLVRHTLILFVIALFFAYTLYPIVEFIDRHTPARFNKMYALILVYLALIAVLSTVGVWLFSNAADEAVHLGQKLPDTIRDQQDRLAKLQLPAWMVPLRQKLFEGASGYLKTSSEQLVPLLRKTGESVVEMAGSLGLLILVPILSFMMLKDATEMRRSLVQGIESGPYRHFFDGLVDDLDLLLAKYIRALVLLSLATLTAYGVVFNLLGVPYAFLLAGIAAAFEFIPVLGPLAAAACTILVAAINGYPHLLWLFGWFLVYRMFQDYVLSPHLMSEGIELHPLLVIFGALAGEQVGGALGMFLSVPVMAAARVMMVRIQKMRLTSHVTRLAANVAPPPLTPGPLTEQSTLSVSP